MATIFENENIYTSAREDEAVHNAKIKERYEHLMNAEATQLFESIYQAERMPAEAPRAEAPVLAPERTAEAPVGYPAYAAPSEPAVRPSEHTGTVDPIVHTRVDSDLFTPETLDRTLQNADYSNYYDFAPTETPAAPVAFHAAEMQAGGAAVAEMSVSAVNAEAVQSDSGYGLSAFAMKMIAAFAGVVITLVGVIGVNSYVIRKKSNHLKRLQQQRERLADETEDLEKRIAEAKSYEKILEYAQNHGMQRLPETP